MKRLGSGKVNITNSRDSGIGWVKLFDLYTVVWTRYNNTHYRVSMEFPTNVRRGFLLPTAAEAKFRFKQWCHEVRLKLTLWPVYFEYMSGDCDRYETRQALRFSSGRAALRFIERAQEETEWYARFGERLTKVEYLAYERWGRDNNAIDAGY